MADEKRVEVEKDSKEEDLFEDVFGLDDELKEARKKLNEAAKKESEKMQKSIYAKEPQNKEAKGSSTEDEEKASPQVRAQKESTSQETAEELIEVHKKSKQSTKKRKLSDKKETKAEATLPSEQTESGKEALGGEAADKQQETSEDDLKDFVDETAPEGKIFVSEPTLEILPKLSFLEDADGNAFIGRSKSTFEKYGSEAALFIGRVSEENYPEKNILMDSLGPHVVFVCGARGSGKSYVLGVIAEELALKNKNVGIIVVDPVGVFWSMRYANREERELASLKGWGLEPRGLENIVVFIPKGMEKQTPAGTYDATFSIKPSMLTAQDWCLTFGLERFSPTGLLLEKALDKVAKGYMTVNKERIKGTKEYSIDDIIFCLENDIDLSSRDKGFKVDSIRALVSRFEASKSWGIFDVQGTPLSELSREGQMTIIDTSFLDDNVTALVIGILARRTLAARKIATRKEAAKRFESSEEMLEIEIPPTWLILDEAHTLIPSGNIKTAASDALIEYVKQGRRPGCSLVFATQQPSAIDVRVLSQLDIIIVHKLVFNDDIKAVYKRTPAIIPHRYKTGSFIRTLPVGVALVCDRREETSRGFVMRIRPRMSQHEGREIETAETKVSLSNEQVLTLITSMYWSRLKRDGQAKLAEIFRTLNSLNAKYSSSVDKKAILAELEKKGATILEKEGLVVLEDKIQRPLKREEDVTKAPSVQQEVLKTQEQMPQKEQPIQKPVSQQGVIELLSFPANVSRESIETKIKKKLSGFFLFGSTEKLLEINLKHIPLYKVEFNYFTKEQNFRQGTLFVNSLNGEFIHFIKGFVHSKGLKELYSLSAEEIFVLNFLTEPLTAYHISRRSFLDEDRVKKILKRLCDIGLAEIFNKEGMILYRLSKDFDLPPSPMHPLHQSLQDLPLVNSEVLMKEQEKYTKNEVRDLLQRIWKRMVITAIKEIYWPVYECITENSKTKIKKRFFVDAVAGHVVNPL
ncbi:MAG: DUF853 family protein [Candidatus Diapherotrites archaeon]|nr:DUF853 family protein [Candidatus Diapherotrites archaeon]